MHDLAPAEELSYEWPKCLACNKDLWNNETSRWACRPCEDKTGKRLAELPGLFARINTTTALMRGARRQGAATSGSRVPPIPPRLEVLSLAAAGGVATRLRDIEDAWRQTLGWTVAPWRGNPGEAVPEHIRFLANNLPWACDSYDSIGQDVEELRRIHSECTAVLSHDPKPGRVKIGLCPVVFDSGRCGAQLTASTASHKVRCPACLTEWPDLASWRDLRRAQEAVEGEMIAA